MGSNGPNFPSPHPPLVVRTTPLEDEYLVGSNVLGAGINGKVVECTDRNGKKCALKVIRDCPESRREVELQWKASSCPQVVSLLAVYQKTEYTSHSMTKKLQVVMECMEGGELFDRISIKDAFTEKEAALIMKEICLAVKHLHDMNIAHRDLKPENLLYGSSEPGAQLKLGDFGFAKQTVDSVGLQSAKYTPYYAAPEVLGPVGRRYGKACDVWSVGVICYVLLSGSPPFYTDNPRLAISPGMKRRIHSAEYTFPPAQWRHISQDAKDLIKGCLRSNPEERLSIDKMLESAWLAQQISVPPTPLLTSKVLQQGNANWKLLQEEFSLALTEMRTADPGEVTLTLKNPKLDGSSLAKRRKTKAELEPAEKTVAESESCLNSKVPDGKGALRVVSEDSGVDVKEQQTTSADGCDKDPGKKEENIWSKEEENVKNLEDEKDFENNQGKIRRDKEEEERDEKAVSQDSVESRASSDSGQDFT